MDLSEREQLELQLAELRTEHRDLDVAIIAMTESPGTDQLSLARMKRRKLAVKDSIAKLESKLIPDLNA